MGCGFTGVRVARQCLRRGVRVIATTRTPEHLDFLRREGAEIIALDAGAADLRALPVPAGVVVLHSVPMMERNGMAVDPTPALLNTLEDRPQRMVYLSTTGVYGAAKVVDERTEPAPRSLRERLRLQAESAVMAGPWESLVLRPAAIYGPGRGVQEAMRRGEFRLRGDGSNWISRIHVDDLAALAEAALFSTVTGAFPVADERPCPSREIAQYCAGLLGLPLPPSAADSDLSETRRADRRVNGQAICRRLGVRLQYPAYLVGIPQSLQFVSDRVF
ncbi:MAG: NAD-dependent epimerase/dehydratase family protein [Bryobacteraceae bacterium]